LAAARDRLQVACASLPTNIQLTGLGQQLLSTFLRLSQTTSAHAEKSKKMSQQKKKEKKAVPYL